MFELWARLSSCNLLLNFIEFVEIKDHKGPSIYYVSKELGGWVQKMAVFGDLQYCIYADFTPLVGGWVRKGPQMC